MTDDLSQTSAPDRVRGFLAPPAELDLPGASAEALARHGVPRRPDPEREPFLAERWAQAFGGRLSIVPAHLKSPPPVLPPTPAFRVGGWAGVGRVRLEPRFLDPEFSGGDSETGDPYVSPATFVSAEWVMPEVAGNPFDLGEYLAIWVGLDGFPEADQDVGVSNTRQILRGGISAWTNGRELRWSARAQWFTSDAGSVDVEIANFPVEDGDRVGVVVCATEPHSASLFFANLSRNQGTSVALEAPGPHVRSPGSTAEWIVEGGDPSTALPFTPVTFESCVAGSSEEVFHLTPDPVLTNMYEMIGVDERGPDVTETRIVSPTSAVIKWIATPV
jgi:Peptidase A4 family